MKNYYISVNEVVISQEEMMNNDELFFVGIEFSIFTSFLWSLTSSPSPSSFSPSFPYKET